jgi:hypothetical protein
MNPTIELTHPVVVVTDDRGHYRAECGCSWASDWYLDDDVTAAAEGADHVDIALGPPDPLDALLSELLDLQDDLAQAVLWFADHYSADLPVPACLGNGDETLIRLLAYTTHDADLDQVAELTGSPALDDAGLNARGYQYRRVIHDFGRVRFETITAIAGLAP